MNKRFATDSKAGKHYWDGALVSTALKGLSDLSETFSVGVFKVERKADGLNKKKGKAIVRVSGLLSDPQPVFKAADKIARELDKGIYQGPKVVHADALERAGKL